MNRHQTHLPIQNTAQLVHLRFHPLFNPVGKMVNKFTILQYYQVNKDIYL